MGLDKVVKDISDKVETECKEIKAKAQVEADDIKKSAEASAVQVHSEELAKADDKIFKMKQRELSSAKLDVKKAKLNSEKEVLETTHETFVGQLSALPKEKKVDIYQKLIKLAKTDIPQGKIFTNAADSDLVKDSEYQYGGNVKCIGGIVVTSVDGSVNLDYTFDSILEDVWTSSMKPVSDILFGSR
ncbi:MAG TPA: V-type ATP synthase subunit E [Methanocella sp.]|nr:V-type ATP synthase subunit E [Methanocella sp.]